MPISSSPLQEYRLKPTARLQGACCWKGGRWRPKEACAAPTCLAAAPPSDERKSRAPPVSTDGAPGWRVAQRSKTSVGWPTKRKAAKVRAEYAQCSIDSSRRHHRSGRRSTARSSARVRLRKGVQAAADAGRGHEAAARRLISPGTPVHLLERGTVAGRPGSNGSREGWTGLKLPSAHMPTTRCGTRISTHRGVQATPGTTLDVEDHACPEHRPSDPGLLLLPAFSDNHLAAA